MAYELQVTVALVDTEPETAGNPGILVRSERASTLVSEPGLGVADAMTIAEARLTALADDVMTDAIGQLQTWQRAFVELEK